MQTLNKALGMLGMVCGLIIFWQIEQLYAFPQDHWVLQSGEQLEVLRHYVCFGEGKAGERTKEPTVRFSKAVLSAEVFISGFNMWQTRGGDSEIAQARIDAWVTEIGPQIVDTKDPRSVKLKFMYSLKDEDPTGGEDFNDACIGYTVIAKTK